MYRIGIDIGGTKINIGIFSQNGIQVANKKLLISEITDITTEVCSVIFELLNESGIDLNELEACGIGIPGTVSKDGKSIIKAPNIDILHSNIADEIEAALNIPTGLIQDSRAAAWGEYLFGAGKGKDSGVCITLGTGIGCGIVLNGRVLDGALGSAGEIGHIPAVNNGRKCGCGKYGCTEKYAAGGGLDITAKTILGDNKTAVDLFDEARNGSAAAQNAVDEAIKMLGNAVISVINLLSPDCILFSGGLSAQKELYVNPVIDYIKMHCYNAGRLPSIGYAQLGENAPLAGAAFAPIQTKREAPIISASLMCADFLNLGKALHDIEDAGIEYIHCDIMDNHFVPNLMLPMEMLNKIRCGTMLAFDYHIMAENPESIIEKLDIIPGDIVSVHYESTNHLQKAIDTIRKRGALVGVALNPSTPIFTLSEILPQLDIVLLMTVNPGFSGQTIAPYSIEKIKKTKEFLIQNNLAEISIEVDGNCSFENAPKMYRAGADILVAGTSSVFKKELTIKGATQKLLALLNKKERESAND